jgi:hypothetical protein
MKNGVALIIWMMGAAYFATAAATETTATQSQNGCPPSVTYQPAPDIAYQEGVDAKGNLVAPAEENPPLLTAEDFKRIPIPLNIPLRNYPAQKPDFAKTAEELQQEKHARDAAAQQPPATPLYNADMSESFMQPSLLTVDTQTGSVQMNGAEITPHNGMMRDCDKKIH